LSIGRKNTVADYTLGINIVGFAAVAQAIGCKHKVELG
jgi:hypothetical protein